ncbi:LysR family transcriptional regulator [Nocardia sp. NPDC056100]|uniref:LysR family transcriptional regulator n=1 Tax=Nocardia sp. NPDC056100 TaxID=3345712 RepID=UPI0035DC2CE8
MDQVDFADLEYVVAVADELSFTRAAARLGITQPPLSRAIAKLERRLGVRLFERTSRAVTPTDAGFTFAADGRAILAATRAAVERVRSSDASRPLSLAVRPAIGSGLLHDILARTEGLALPIPIRVHLTRSPARAVLNGDADAALSCLTTAPAPLHTEELIEQPTVALLPRNHPLAQRYSLQLDEVTALPGHLHTCPDLDLDEIIDHIHLRNASALASHDVIPRLGEHVRAVPVIDAPGTTLGLVHHPERTHPRLADLITQARRAAYVA